MSLYTFIIKYCYLNYIYVNKLRERIDSGGNENATKSCCTKISIESYLLNYE